MTELASVLAREALTEADLAAARRENERLREVLAKGVKLLRHIYGSKAGFASAAKEWLAEAELELRRAGEGDS